MGSIIVIAFFILVGWTLKNFLDYKRLIKEGEKLIKKVEEIEKNNKNNIIPLLALVMISIFTSGCGIKQVDEGFRGIKKRWGKVEGQSLTPGLYFYNPISSSIFEMDVRENKWTEKTSVFTRDTQHVDVEFATTIYPNPEKIGAIYSQFGREWEAKIISPVLLSTIKDKIGQYKADDLVSNRQNFQSEIFKNLVIALKDRDVVVTRFDVVNLDFEDAYEHAIEAKVVAIQNAHEAKNKTVRIEEEAKQKVLSAKAEAESMRIRSQALSQNKNLVDYEAVQKWNGQLPNYMLGNSVPFINMGIRHEIP